MLLEMAVRIPYMLISSDHSSRGHFLYMLEIEACNLAHWRVAEQKRNDEMNEILRPPLRQKKSTGKPWGHGDAPRNRWLQEIGMLESDDDELIEEDEDWEDIAEEVLEVQSLSSVAAEAEQREIPLEECVFSGFISKSWEDNLKYMAQKHDFRIPDLARVGTLSFHFFLLWVLFP